MVDAPENDPAADAIPPHDAVPHPVAAIVRRLATAGAGDARDEEHLGADDRPWHLEVQLVVKFVCDDETSTGDRFRGDHLVVRLDGLRGVGLRSGSRCDTNRRLRPLCTRSGAAYAD